MEGRIRIRILKRHTRKISQVDILFLCMYVWCRGSGSILDVNNKQICTLSQLIYQISNVANLSIEGSTFLGDGGVEQLEVERGEK